MRLRTLSLTLLLAALAPEAALAAQSEVPRHRPRVTDEAEGEDDYGTSTSKKKKRKHATQLDEEPAVYEPPASSRKRSWTDDSEERPAAPAPAPSPDDADLPPPRKARTTTAEDESYESAPPKRTPRAAPVETRSATRPPARGDDAGSDEEVRGSRGRDRDDDSELRSESDRRPRGKSSSRTVEEEIGEYEEFEDETLSRLDEPGIGMSAELILGPAFLHSPLPGMSTKFGFGINLSLQLGRYLFAPEWDFLHRNFILELGWLMAGANTDAGTDEVRVGSGGGVNTLSLAVLFGYPLSDFLIYAKIGPLLSIMSVKYDVQGELSTFTGVKGGLVYGGGARASIYTNDALGIAARIEVLGSRRGYVNDVMLAFGVGVAF